MDEDIVRTDDVEDASKHDIKKIVVEIPVDVKNTVETDDIELAFEGGMNLEASSVLTKFSLISSSNASLQISVITVFSTS